MYLLAAMVRASSAAPLIVLLVLPRAAAFSTLSLPPLRQSSSQRGPTRRCALPTSGLATEDLIPVIFAGALATSAGLLQYSLSAGETGISAYLSKEKANNPFYNYRKSARPASRRSGEPRLAAGGDGDEDWAPIPLLSVENAGPIAILLTVFLFLGLATLPRETLPPLVQQLIPLVLGRQYAAPPPS